MQKNKDGGTSLTAVATVSAVQQGQLPHAAPRFTQAHPDADWVCEHGTACDVHCCNCHSGFLFDVDSCVCVFPGDGGGEVLEAA
jgi:hypothetical protein